MADYIGYVRYKLLQSLLDSIAAASAAARDLEGKIASFDQTLSTDSKQAAYDYSDIIALTKQLEDLQNTIQDVNAQLTDGWVTRLFD